MMVEEQVRLAQNGDDEVFFELVTSVKGRLYKIALSYVKDEHEALEAIQETSYQPTVLGWLFACKSQIV